jgi:hypothetical protein
MLKGDLVGFAAAVPSTKKAGVTLAARTLRGTEKTIVIGE